jgi:hypothetical protein
MRVCEPNEEKKFLFSQNEKKNNKKIFIYEGEAKKNRKKE